MHGRRTCLTFFHLTQLLFLADSDIVYCLCQR